MPRAAAAAAAAPLALLLGCFLASASRSDAAANVKLIIDTDIGGGGCKDVDDVIAVCIANALADNGEADLVAVVQNTGINISKYLQNIF
eukprot:SAG31_NODE_1772_length_7306_cov_3.341335_12_plen_89_part_00